MKTTYTKDLTDSGEIRDFQKRYPGQFYLPTRPVFKAPGFDIVQIHDGDAVPGLDDLAPEQMRQSIADQELAVEFIARTPLRASQSHQWGVHFQ